MRTFYKTFTRLTAAALLVAMSATPGFAVKTTPATDKNTNVPAVPRAIPDLQPYHNFDPPAGAVFDASKLTISGDMRVRPEFRSKGGFGVSAAPNAAGKFTDSDDQSSFFTQQLIRLGFHYALSPDVAFFVQPQVSHNWGTVDPNSGSGGINPNGTGSDLFLRQGFMLVRNFLAPNLSLKAGRQLMVWGNHRIFGHFDWNNVGFAFDGVTMRYNHAQVPVEFGWLRVAEGNCADSAGGCGVGTASADTNDADIWFVRLPMKFGGFAVEPAWIFENGGAGSASQGAGGTGASIAGGNFPTTGQPQNQSRHTVGARIATKQGIVDATTEGYWQFGSMGPASTNGGNRNERINALAFHIDGGITMPVPMQPRIGAEFNYATGDGNCNGDNPQCGGTFSQLFPTNHIHFGYMDRMAWQNMLTYGGNLQMRPTANSHFEVGGHIMRLANRNDNWYGADQAVFKTTPAGNKEKSLGGEIDVVYTLFFHNNKVAWQVGYGHFFAGDYLTKNDVGSAANDQDWGYTQLWINF
ncbi:MAG: alginate export family protein [Nitrospirales bacterium]